MPGPGPSTELTHPPSPFPRPPRAPGRSPTVTEAVGARPSLRRWELSVHGLYPASRTSRAMAQANPSNSRAIATIAFCLVMFRPINWR